MYTQRWLMKKKVRERSLAGTFREGVHVWPWFESLSNCSSSLRSAAGMWLALRGNRLGDPPFRSNGRSDDRWGSLFRHSRQRKKSRDLMRSTWQHNDTYGLLWILGFFLHSCISVHYLMGPSLEREEGGGSIHHLLCSKKYKVCVCFMEKLSAFFIAWCIRLFLYHKEI